MEVIIKTKTGDVELKGCTVSMHQMITEVNPLYSETNFVQKALVGEPIIIITKGMPSDLQSTIDRIITKYCNH